MSDLKQKTGSVACYTPVAPSAPEYGMVPKGLLTFLGFLGNAEFSPWKRLPELIELRKS